VELPELLRNAKRPCSAVNYILIVLENGKVYIFLLRNMIGDNMSKFKLQAPPMRGDGMAKTRTERLGPQKTAERNADPDGYQRFAGFYFARTFRTDEKIFRKEVAGHFLSKDLSLQQMRDRVRDLFSPYFDFKDGSEPLDMVSLKLLEMAEGYASAPEEKRIRAVESFLTLLHIKISEFGEARNADGLTNALGKFCPDFKAGFRDFKPLAEDRM
jgi:hypothetical protein